MVAAAVDATVAPSLIAASRSRQSRSNGPVAGRRPTAWWRSLLAGLEPAVAKPPVALGDRSECLHHLLVVGKLFLQRQYDIVTLLLHEVQGILPPEVLEFLGLLGHVELELGIVLELVGAEDEVRSQRTWQCRAKLYHHEVIVRSLTSRVDVVPDVLLPLLDADRDVGVLLQVLLGLRDLQTQSVLLQHRALEYHPMDSPPCLEAIPVVQVLEDGPAVLGQRLIEVLPQVAREDRRVHRRVNDPGYLILGDAAILGLGPFEQILAVCIADEVHPRPPEPRWSRLRRSVSLVILCSLLLKQLGPLTDAGLTRLAVLNIAPWKLAVPTVSSSPSPWVPCSFGSRIPEAIHSLVASPCGPCPGPLDVGSKISGAVPTLTCASLGCVPIRLTV